MKIVAQQTSGKAKACNNLTEDSSSAGKWQQMFQFLEFWKILVLDGGLNGRIHLYFQVAFPKEGMSEQLVSFFSAEKVVRYLSWGH